MNLNQYKKQYYSTVPEIWLQYQKYGVFPLENLQQAPQPPYILSEKTILGTAGQPDKDGHTM